MSITDFNCTYNNGAGVNEEIVQKTKLKFPDAYKNWEDMAVLAKEIKNHEDASFCTLPFCHTLEGEALGAVINYGDERIGPRGKDYLTSSIEDLLSISELDFSKGRLAEVLNACSHLRQEGENVALYISGPFTILNLLIDLRYVFKAFKKSPEVMEKILEKLRVELLRFIREAQNMGVNIFSYGDSSGGLNILGPKLSEQIVEMFTYQLLKEAQQIITEDSIMLLCPKTSFALIGTNKAKWKNVELVESMKYHKACVSMIGKAKFLGEMCIKNKNYILKDKVIKSIELL